MLASHARVAYPATGKKTTIVSLLKIAGIKFIWMGRHF
jgi:hypothetical protein